MKPKIESYLGFAKKSGNIVEGSYSCEASIKKKKIQLIILAEDLGNNSKEKMEELCGKNDIEILIYSTKESIGKLLGKKETGIIGIKDTNFAKMIRTEIEKERDCKI